MVESTTDNTTASELERLDTEIATLASQLDAATYRFLTLIHAFDARQGWAAGGFRSCAHYLNWRVSLALGAAREHVRVARALPELPGIAEALRRGQLSYSKVRAMTRVATPQNEAELLAMALAATASQVETIVRAFRRCLDVDQARDRRCAFFGCTHQRYLQPHHIQHWADGGPTTVDNLVLLCSFHHRMVHEGGFGCYRREDGTVVFVGPDGRALSATAPAARAVDTEEAIAAVRDQLAREGIVIDEGTAGRWEGDRLDLGWAIEYLMEA